MFEYVIEQRYNIVTFIYPVMNKELWLYDVLSNYERINVLLCQPQN